MKSLIAVAALTLFASNALAKGELIHLDPGHTKDFPGVTGTCGTQEAWVNDQLTLRVTRLLQAEGYRVRFSRELIANKTDIAPKDGRESPESLRARGEGANRARAALFVSIHHDSMKEEHLIEDTTACGGQIFPDMRKITPEFLEQYKVGFNVFIHNDESKTAKYGNSKKLASLIGANFVALEQTPANFHVPEVEDDCASCKIVDEANGVMHRNLGAIRIPTMPSVLIEVTNLRIPALEVNANDEAFREKIAEAIVHSINQYYGRL